MKKLLRAAVTTMGFATASAMAGDFDGSKTLICASEEAIECTPGAPCSRGAPEALGAPNFMRIDFAAKAVVGPKRTSTIAAVEKTEAELLVQGTELGFGWTIALDQASGRMTVTLADREGAFVLFGVCTPL